MTALADISYALALGQRLDEFEIREVIGAGGFGIVYRAFDHALQREVAIKEYLPASLAARVEGLRVSVVSGSRADHFALGLRSFVNEARLLARFDHPALLKVHRFWEANGTAYMAMALYRGRNLRQQRDSLGGAPDEAWLRGLLAPLLGALEALHEQEVYHRDIAPDNILVTGSGAPVLLDFGAARHVLREGSPAVTSILKPGFAPVEQYGESTELRQGPWTDLYALGATLHYLITGAPPAPATARAIGDAGPPLAAQAPDGLSPELLRIVDWMLEPRPQRRPQSVAQLRAALAGELAPPPPRPAREAPGAWLPTEQRFPAAAHGPAAARPALEASPAALKDSPAQQAVRPPPAAEDQAARPPAAAQDQAARPPAAEDQAARPPAAATRRRWPALAAIAATAVLALGGAALWLGQGLPAPPVQAAAPPPAAEPVPRKAATAAAKPLPSRELAATAHEARVLPTATRVAAPADPRAACSGRMLLALHRCLQRECARPEMRGHPTCAEVRRIDEANVMPSP